MRPSFEEQLTGASRLLSLAKNEPTADGVAELVRNARRLVDHVTGACAVAGPFLCGDNAELAWLLNADDPTTIVIRCRLVHCSGRIILADADAPKTSPETAAPKPQSEPFLVTRSA